MPCQVGITTDPDRRKKEWESLTVGLKNWSVLRWYNTKSAAQAAETRAANSSGCNHGVGGGGSENARWAVYKFDYTRRR